MPQRHDQSARFESSSAPLRVGKHVGPEDAAKLLGGRAAQLELRIAEVDKNFEARLAELEQRVEQTELSDEDGWQQLDYDINIHLVMPQAQALEDEIREIASRLKADSGERFEAGGENLRARRSAGQLRRATDSRGLCAELCELLGYAWLELL